MPETTRYRPAEEIAAELTDGLADWRGTERQTTAVYDGNSMELPPRVVHIAIKWLMWQHGMTMEEAGAVMASLPRGNTKQRQRQEAIDVADFVEHQGNG